MSFTPQRIGVTLFLLAAMFYAPARALVGIVNARGFAGYWRAEAIPFKLLVVAGIGCWLGWVVWWVVVLASEERERRGE